MTTKLEKLLADIDPSVTINRISSKVDAAFNSFTINASIIRTFDDYLNYIPMFVRHIDQRVIGYSDNIPYSREIYWNTYLNLMNKKYGPSAWTFRYDSIMTGKDGGLNKLLKDVADLMLEDYIEREITFHVLNYWNNLTIDEKLAAPGEYAKKYGHLLPPEFTAGNAPFLKVNFVKVLEDYPRMVMEVRKLPRANT